MICICLIRIRFSLEFRLGHEIYSYLSLQYINSQGGWNIQGGRAKFPELINKEEEIDKEGGIFWKMWSVY